MLSFVSRALRDHVTCLKAKLMKKMFLWTKNKKPACSKYPSTFIERMNTVVSILKILFCSAEHFLGTFTGN